MMGKLKSLERVCVGERRVTFIFMRLYVRMDAARGGKGRVSFKLTRIELRR